MAAQCDRQGTHTFALLFLNPHFLLEKIHKETMRQSFHFKNRHRHRTRFIDWLSDLGQCGKQYELSIRIFDTKRSTI